MLVKTNNHTYKNFDKRPTQLWLIYATEIIIHLLDQNQIYRTVEKNFEYNIVYQFFADILLETLHVMICDIQMALRQIKSFQYWFNVITITIISVISNQTCCTFEFFLMCYDFLLYLFMREVFVIINCYLDFSMYTYEIISSEPYLFYRFKFV